jgi:hypothetical protein
MLKSFVSLCVALSLATAICAQPVTVTFRYAPGPDGRLNTPDDFAYPALDYSVRQLDDEYASLGLHISGTATTPVLFLVGGGLDPDMALGNASNNAVLRGSSSGVLSPVVLRFDSQQTSVRVDVYANINFSGTSVPVTLRRAGVVVGSLTLTSANAVTYTGTAGQLGGRWLLQTSGAGTFDEATLGLSGPSGGGIMLDNITFMPPPPPRTTVNFFALPGTDGLIGTADDIPFGATDFTTFGGTRDIDFEYQTLGLLISGSNGAPRVSLIGGGLDPDGALGNPSNNAVLRGAGGSGLTQVTLRFTRPQTAVRADLWAAINASGNAAPITLRRGGVVVATDTLTSANALVYNGTPTQLSGRWEIAPSLAPPGTFDEITFALTLPNNGGLFIDNLAFVAKCPSDFNSSGTSTVQDLFDFIAAYFAAGPNADFNGVNGPTVQDLFDFIAAYFRPCP